jgi:hypothetical protein
MPLAATWAFHENMELRAGYRLVEGGADNDEVYSFAWLHDGVIGLRTKPGMREFDIHGVK